MRKYVLISGVVFILIYILSHPSLAIEVEKCKYCHGTVKPIPKESITKSCSTCHGMHSTNPEPGIRIPEEVHSKHKEAGKTVRQSNCLHCHQSPVGCTSCHNSHDIDSIKRAVLPRISKNESKNISINILCTDCHGQLPQPKGHGEFRDALSKSKHRWMICDSCHLNSYDTKDNSYNFKLNFKNIFVIPIEESIKICKICHSSQYERMTEGTHGTLNKTCIDCHNPHTTKLTGPKFGMITTTPKPMNASMRIEKGTNWLFKKVPILNNPTLMIVIIIVMFAFASEYFLSKHEKGQKVAYNMVKFNAGEETLKTLEVKLKDQNISIVNGVLEKYGNILGMTMTKEEDKALNIYKYIIFIDANKPMDETDEKDLIDKILSLNNIKSVELTDKYEL